MRSTEEDEAQGADCIRCGGRVSVRVSLVGSRESEKRQISDTHTSPIPNTRLPKRDPRRIPLRHPTPETRPPPNTSPTPDPRIATPATSRMRRGCRGTRRHRRLIAKFVVGRNGRRWFLRQVRPLGTLARLGRSTRHAVRRRCLRRGVCGMSHRRGRILVIAWHLLAAASAEEKKRGCGGNHGSHGEKRFK